MKWRRIVPTCITLTILLLGFEGILKSIEGQFTLAANLIILAAILDGMDGEVARLFKGVTTFGAKLDTYVDVVCFGVAPAVLVHQAVFKEAGLFGTAFVSFILISAVIRFATYQVKESRVKQNTYSGLPIPVSAIWMCMTLILADSHLFAQLGAAGGPLMVLLWTAALAFLVLQVSSVKFAKPTKEMIILGLSILGVCVVVVRNPMLAFCIATLISMVIFTFVMPFYVKKNLLSEEEEEESVTLTP